MNICLDQYEALKGIKIMSSKLTTTCAMFVSIAAFAFMASPVIAQCDPPEQNVKCWDGGGDGVTWNLASNWNPTGVPGSQHTVYHLNGDEISFDLGSYQSPEYVASVIFDPENAGGLTIEPDTALWSYDDFVTQGTPGATLYDLTVDDGAFLFVENHIDAVAGGSS